MNLKPLKSTGTYKVLLLEVFKEVGKPLKSTGTGRPVPVIAILHYGFVCLQLSQIPNLNGTDESLNSRTVPEVRNTPVGPSKLVCQCEASALHI